MLHRGQCAQCLWWAEALGPCMWVDNMLPLPKHGATVNWARLRSQTPQEKTPENLEKCWCHAACSWIFLQLLLVFGLPAAGSNLMILCLFVRWARVSVTQDRFTYLLGDVYGTDKTFHLFSTPYLGVISGMFASTGGVWNKVNCLFHYQNHNIDLPF